MLLVDTIEKAVILHNEYEYLLFVKSREGYIHIKDLKDNRQMYDYLLSEVAKISLVVVLSQHSLTLKSLPFLEDKYTKF